VCGSDCAVRFGTRARAFDEFDGFFHERSIFKLSADTRRTVSFFDAKVAVNYENCFFFLSISPFVVYVYKYTRAITFARYTVFDELLRSVSNGCRPRYVFPVCTGTFPTRIYRIAATAVTVGARVN